MDINAEEDGSPEELPPPPPPLGLPKVASLLPQDLIVVYPPMSNATSATVQHINLLSSTEDMEEIKTLSTGFGSGFKGFASIGGQSWETVGEEEEIESIDEGKLEELLCIVEAQHSTPLKITKEQLDGNEPANPSAEPTTQNVQTPTDQIVEVNSDSTTVSQKKKRLERLKHNLERLQKTPNTNNKRSSESSEFPLSSPSNPQLDRGSFPQRSALLKNTLPADSFERQLALITVANPQMSLIEKVNSWQCDEDLSDVEDVNSFDDLFTKEERNRKLSASDATKEPVCVSTELFESEIKKFTFMQFRALMLERVKNPRKKIEHSHDAEKPSTSAAAQRRLKSGGAAAETDAKKRTQKDGKRAQQNCANKTAHGTTSSDDDCYPSPKKKQHASLKTTQNVLVLDGVLCLTSSDEDVTLHNRKTAQSAPRIAANANVAAKQQITPLEKKPATATGNVANTAAVTSAQEKQKSTRLKRLSTEAQSIFRLNRLNPEIDKKPQSAPQRLIQMRLDSLDEKREKTSAPKNDHFKTPIAPLPKSQRRVNNIIKEIPNSATAVESQSIPVFEEFHQQHEFCNYLGLQGMSTAAAVANATAELSEFKLTRRSLRVRRLQQQAKKKEKQKQEKKNIRRSMARKELEALKIKQLRALRRYSKDGKGTNTSELEESMKKGSRYANHNQTNNGGFRKPYTSSPTQAATTTSEIKIICQLSPEKKEITKKSVAPKITAKTIAPAPPQRKSLMRHIKRDAASSNGTSTCPRSSHSEADDADESRSVTTPNQLRNGGYNNSPKLHAANSPSPTTRQQSLSGKSYRNSQSPQSHTKSASPTKPEIGPMAYKQIQECLEVSRQAKPSIFIVQTLDSESKRNSNRVVEEKPKKLKTKSNAKSKDLKGSIVRELVEQPSMRSRKLQKHLPQSILRANTNPKTKQRLQKLLTRSNMNTQRQLRSRQIIIFNSIKRAPKPKTKEKSTQKADISTPTSDVLRELENETEEEEASMEKKKAHQSINKSCHLINEPAEMLFKNDKNIFDTITSEQPSKTITDSEKIHCTTDNINLSATNSEQTTQSNTQVENSLSRTAEKNVDATTSEQISQAGIESVNILFRTDKKNISATTTEESLRSLQPPEPVLTTNFLKLAPINTAADTPNTNAKTTGSNVTFVMSANQNLDNDLVVVSSTTNINDEAIHNVSSQVPVTNNTKELFKNYCFVDAASVTTKESAIQCDRVGIHYFNTPPAVMPNPLKTKYGCVLYIYYELDVLIVIQESLVSFWKYSKLINVLLLCHKQQQKLAPSLNENETVANEWIQLGQCKRLQKDIELTSTPFANRICIHNSIPIYVEMRCREIPKEHRTCNLLSVYVNVYYYQDEEWVAKMHSIQLDSVQSVPSSVVYTTITESRYFVMTWSQQNDLGGKLRAGLCKYSLTPHLDTLASIRGFKDMRHEIRYLECSSDDKLLGFGATQLTIWDHRSGDVLMNYNLDINLGRNLGSIYYPRLEVGQKNMILIFQYIKDVQIMDSLPELLVIACSISHATPSYRILHRQILPVPAFNDIACAINTSEHVIITAQCDDELWISCIDPHCIMYVPAQQTRRFYARNCTQFIELTDNALTLNSFANHALKLAATEQ